MHKLHLFIFPCYMLCNQCCLLIKDWFFALLSNWVFFIVAHAFFFFFLYNYFAYFSFFFSSIWIQLACKIVMFLWSFPTFFEELNRWVEFSLFCFFFVFFFPCFAINLAYLCLHRFTFQFASKITLS